MVCAGSNNTNTAMPNMSHSGRRVLFVHDGPIYVGPDRIPRGVHYTDALIDRYMGLGSELTFLMRAADVPQAEAERYSPLVRTGFRFLAVANVKSLSSLLTRGRQVRRIVAEQVANHEVVVVRLPSTLGRWAFREAKRLNKPVLVEFMGCAWDTLWYHSWKGKLAAPWYFWRNLRLMRKANHVVYVTERFLQKRYPSPGKSIACSNVVISPADPQVLVKRLQWIEGRDTRERIVLATMGATNIAYKNQALVIKALSRLGRDRHRFLYRVIGQGDPARLRTLARRLGVEDCVDFVGAVRHAEVPTWLDSTDIYIQPSRTEGLPRALIEAMSRGCAGLGSAGVGGIPELLPPDRLFAPSDAVSLSRLIAEFDAEKLRHDAERNFARASDYTSDVLEARRQAFFEEFLKDNTGRLPA